MSKNLLWGVYHISALVHNNNWQVLQERFTFTS